MAIKSPIGCLNKSFEISVNKFMAENTSDNISDINEYGLNENGQLNVDNTATDFIMK